MITVIYRSLKDGRVGSLYFKGNGVLNHFSDKEWEETYSKYKVYFDKRICSDSNPGGQYILPKNKTENYIKGQHKEFGDIEVDTSKEAIEKRVDKQMEEIAPELAKIRKKNKTKRKSKGKK